MTRFIPGAGLSAIAPDNMPGVFSPPVPPPPPPRTPAPNLPAGLTAVQTHVATHDYASHGFEDFRRQLPASDLPTRAREFAATPAAQAADAAVQGVRDRRDAAQAAITAVQAAAGEATLIGTNQDQSLLGVGDAASGLATQTSGIAIQPAGSPQFTRED